MESGLGPGIRLEIKALGDRQIIRDFRPNQIAPQAEIQSVGIWSVEGKPQVNELRRSQAELTHCPRHPPLLIRLAQGAVSI